MEFLVKETNNVEESERSSSTGIQVKRTRDDIAKLEKRSQPWKNRCQKVIKNERGIINNDDERVNIPLDCGNKTGTGLVENEVTRRGNSPGEEKVRGEDLTRGRAKGQRVGRKITSNICSRAVPGRCRREKSANQEKLSPGDSERILFEMNAREGHSRPIL